MNKEKLTLEVRARGMIANNDLDIKVSMYEKEAIDNIKNNALKLIQPFIKQTQDYLISMYIFSDEIDKNEMCNRKCIDFKEIFATYIYMDGHTGCWIEKDMIE